MKIFGYGLLVLGFFLIAGAVGAQDFYDECKRAADCVAGAEPSGLVMFSKFIIGLGLMAIGVLFVKAEEIA